MTLIPDQPCAHPDCGCKVEQAGAYCSDDCRSHGTSHIGGRCTCGHSDCLIEEALQRADEAPAKRGR